MESLVVSQGHPILPTQTGDLHYKDFTEAWAGPTIRLTSG